MAHVMSPGNGSAPAIASEPELRVLVDQVQAPILVTDAVGRPLLVNEAYAAHHPIPPAGVPFAEWSSSLEFLGTDGTTRLPTAEAPLARILRGEVLDGVEYTMPDRLGERRRRRAHGRALRDADGRITGAVVVFHDVTDQRLAEDALREFAIADSLTGLPNAALVANRLRTALRRAERHDSCVAVLTIDVDRIGSIDDAYGRTVSDRVIVELGQRIARELSSTDTVARTGSDEFTIVLEDAGDPGQVWRTAEHLRLLLRDAVELERATVHPSVSIGAVVPGTAPSNVETVIQHARRALRLAKDRGGDRVELADEGPRGFTTRWGQIERALERALANDGLRCYFQPMVHARTRRIVAFEALVRCEDPELGILMPAEFLPIAEATGQLPGIDTWMLDRACARLRTWTTAFPELGLVVCVNLSATMLGRIDLVDVVGETLRRHGLRHADLRLEMTESILLQVPPRARAALRHLRQLGVGISLDDFGTGHASIAHLRDLPLSHVKIDRSLIVGIERDDDVRNVVDAMVRLAQALGLKVTAEGVETVGEAAALADLGCDHLQGYLISRPAPGDELNLTMRWQPPARVDDEPILL